MSLAPTKARFRDALTGLQPRIVADAHRFLSTPELGFKEARTAGAVASVLTEAGYELRTGLAGTGLAATCELERPGPTVCVMGELDSLPMPEHASADPDTGVAQACGHYLQLTHLAALARLFADPANRAGLAGRLVFLAVPAEEYVDLAWRREQLVSGARRAMTGKQELLLDGFFDDVDIAMMCHAGGQNQQHGFTSRAGSAGFVGKRVRFGGQAAHAGRSPDAGVNALQAMTVALMALNANRDAFPEATTSRVHGTVTSISDTVSIVPERAEMDFMIRAQSLEDVRALEDRFERSMVAGAVALGCSLTIETLPGYLPRLVDPQLEGLAADNAGQLWGPGAWVRTPPASSATDAGDLSHHLPVLHPNHGGCTGAPHSVDFGVADERMAMVDPALLMASTIADLLGDDAARAREIVDAHEPSMTPEDYRSWAGAGVRAVHLDAATSSFRSLLASDRSSATTP